MALVLDVGPPGVGGGGRCRLRGLEGRQVPLEPLTAAHDAAAPWADGDQALLFEELERSARGLSADVVARLRARAPTVGVLPVRAGRR